MGCIFSLVTLYIFKMVGQAASWCWSVNFKIEYFSNSDQLYAKDLQNDNKCIQGQMSVKRRRHLPPHPYCLFRITVTPPNFRKAQLGRRPVSLTKCNPIHTVFTPPTCAAVPELFLFCKFSFFKPTQSDKMQSHSYSFHTARPPVPELFLFLQMFV